MTDRIMRDDAIATIMEYFPGNTINDPKYAAGKALVEALSALPAVDDSLQKAMIELNATKDALAEAVAEIALLESRGGRD